jgi:CRP/FNR family transcriptional regulator
VKLDPSAFVADPDLIKAIETHATQISCGGDRILFNQGDEPQGLYVLDKGTATLTMNSPAGVEVMRIDATAGSLLGLPGLIGNEPYSLTATARKDAQLCFIARDEFASLMQANPHLSLQVLKVLAAEVRSAREAILNR